MMMENINNTTPAADEEESLWICPLCGYVHGGETPPDKCPMCGAPGTTFHES